LRSAEAAAKKFNVDVDQAPVREPAEIEAVMIRLARDPGGGLIFPPDSFIRTHRRPIVEAAAHYRLPAVYSNRLYPEVGGLPSYSADGIDMFRRSATYVDRARQRDKPADLPVMQPTKLELVINLKTANALDLTISPKLLAVADEVIE
jgi:putative tryptophan/tyrosine transport system substrate-binding protein